MTAAPLAIKRTGLVTSVGLNAPAVCAAIRSGLTNPGETRFIDADGDWIMSHGVPLAQPVRGPGRVAQMAAMAVEEALRDVPRHSWGEIPLLLCVAEEDRPGRLEGLDDELIVEIQALLSGACFAESSSVIPYGRVSVGVALLEARKLLSEPKVATVLIAASDTLLHWPTLRVFEAQQRLLTPRHSNGFIPGEGAAALLLSRPGADAALHITGLGFGTEEAHINSEAPLRADGLTTAINQALQDAGRQLHEMDFRITDISGEHYYFKEAALALSRTLRRRKEEFDIWHPAECIGEVGCAIGPVMLAVAEASGRKAYAPGAHMLLHASNDAGQRMAIIASYGQHDG